MNKKIAIGTSSLAAALAGWLLLSALNVFVVWALRDRARLVRDNDNERTLNTLFTEMRNYSDFGAAIESSPALKDRIIGAAVYDNSLRPVYQWGKVPPVFDETLVKKAGLSRFGRYTIPDRRGRSVRFVLRFDRMGPPGRPPENRQPDMPPPDNSSRPSEGRPPDGRQPDNPETWPDGGSRPERRPDPSSLFNFRGRYFYTDISHPAYWRALTLTAIAFPLVEIAMLILVFYIRRLYLRNREYREKIEAQHNLVVLGTAAGTLAHEIKNPLLSIRLQTGILEKTAGENGRDEITIINQEVDRLSSLVYRVNDYLREPEGEKSPLNIAALLRETSLRLCGADITINSDDNNQVRIFADENRVRSVLENVIRNAMDSGSALGDIKASLEAGGASRSRSAVIRIVDRGKGIAEKDLKRVFDPFFTTKSAGTGIGLAISRRFTEAAGGTIGIENRADGGVMVTLAFPLYDGEAKQ